jgi:hypothetical protein
MTGQMGPLIGQCLNSLQKLDVLGDLSVGGFSGDLYSPFESPICSLRLGIRPAGKPAGVRVVSRENQQEYQGPCFPGSPLESRLCRWPA